MPKSHGTKGMFCLGNKGYQTESVLAFIDYYRTLGFGLIGKKSGFLEILLLSI